jgi:hypothetical protein
VVRVIALATLLSIAGCGAAMAPAAARGTVEFDVTPPTARVYTEDRFVGSLAVLTARPPSFPVGPRQLTIVADGYFPIDVPLEVVPEGRTIHVDLIPIPP